MRHQGIKAMVTMVAASLASTGAAQHSDVFLAVQNNRVVTGTMVSGSPIVPERVFETEFGEAPNATTEPGFNAAPGSLPGGQPVGVTIRRAARVWSGGDFCLIPDERLRVRKSGVTVETPAADPPTLSGLSLELGTTDPFDGLFHEHAVFSVTAPFDAGVYALELEVWIGEPGGAPAGVAPSEPIWIVFGQATPDAQVEEAVEWLRSTGAVCPAACPCDWNRSGNLSVQDIFDFLSAYFAGAGDFNGVAGTSVQDMFDFLGCYLDGCG